MKIKVNPHKLEIEKTPVNEKEINITKCIFEFDEEITDNFVKEAYFTLNNNTYKQIILNNECDIPSEVLEEKGQVEIGVVAFLVEDEEEIKRYNPSPAYFNTWDGSLKEANNSEPITPSDKEQIEQMLSNINLSVSKVGKVTTISFTNTNGETQTEQLEDGIGLQFNWDGTSLGIKREDEATYQYVDLKGDKGEPGAIKMVIVNTLPETGADDTIYLVPITGETGNNYEEYIYVNNAWEKLGGIQVQVDLTDYVKNTDYATDSKGGVFETSDTYAIAMENGKLRAKVKAYSQYSGLNTYAFISKGTLENTITGKELVNATDLATKQNIMQYSTMPTASLSNVGNVVQYIGTTDSSYIKGRFYECVESSSTYSWSEVSFGSSVNYPVYEIDGATNKYMSVMIGSLSNDEKAVLMGVINQAIEKNQKNFLLIVSYPRSVYSYTASVYICSWYINNNNFYMAMSFIGGNNTGNTWMKYAEYRPNGYLKATFTGTVTNGVVTSLNQSAGQNTSFLLYTDNTSEFTPTGNYQPATKKYVDDLVGNIGTVIDSINGESV